MAQHGNPTHGIIPANANECASARLDGARAGVYNPRIDPTGLMG